MAIDKIKNAICDRTEINCDDCVFELVCKPKIQAIQALIAADRAERVCKKCLKAYDAPSLCPVCQLKSTDDSFDKGFETGKTEGQIEAARDRAGLVEALEVTRRFITNQYWDGSDAHLKVLVKIDKALEGVK